MSYSSDSKFETFPSALDRAKIGKFTASYCPTSGALHWESKETEKKNLTVCITPFWDGEEKLPVNVIDIDYNEILNFSIELSADATIIDVIDKLKEALQRVEKFI